MAEDERRPFTAEERKVLGRMVGLPALAKTLSWFSLVWDIGAPSCMLTGCLGLILTLLVIAGIGLLPLKIDKEQVRPLVFLFFIFVWILIPIVIIAIRFPRERNKREALDEQFDLQEEKRRRDLEGGVALVKRYRAKDAIRGILEEHRERIFFVRLEDDRIMCLGFWNPPEDDNPAEIQGLPSESEGFPSTEFELARAPTSGILLSTRGSGQPLKPSTTFVVKQGWRYPEPPVDQFLELPWDDIIKSFG